MPRLMRVRFWEATLFAFASLLSVVFYSWADDPGEDYEPTIHADASTLERWVSEHQLLLAVLLVALIPAAALALARLVRGRAPAPAPPTDVVPEAVAPAFAYALATLESEPLHLVLPTLLDLVDRGLYVATLEAQPEDGGPRRLLIALPPNRSPVTETPVMGRPEFEHAVLRYFDQLIGRRPGSVTGLMKRFPQYDRRQQPLWRSVTSGLEAVADQELSWDRDLRWLRLALVPLGLGALAALIALALQRSSEVPWLIAAAPLVTVGVMLVPPNSVRRLEPEVLDRHERWRAFADGLKRRSPRDPRTALPARQWSRMLALSLAFNTVEQFWGSTCVGPPADLDDEGHWAAELGDSKLTLLDSEYPAFAFGDRFNDWIEMPSSDVG